MSFPVGHYRYLFKYEEGGAFIISRHPSFIGAERARDHNDGKGNIYLVGDDGALCMLE